MKIRPVCLLAFALSGFVIPSSAQTGSVTFYSIQLSVGKQIDTALSPKSTGSFTGWLFDGDKRLAHASRGRFMTLQLAVGPHDFSVPWKSEGMGKHACKATDCLHLDVESGGHYCVRLFASEVNTIVVPLVFLDSRIEQVTCQAAFQEAGKYKRIDPKRVEPGVRSALDDSPDFPRAN